MTINTDIYAFPIHEGPNAGPGYSEYYTDADREAAIMSHASQTEMGPTWVLTQEEAGYLLGDSTAASIYSSKDRVGLRVLQGGGYGLAIGENLGAPRSGFAKLQDRIVNNAGTILSKVLGVTIGAAIPGLTADIDSSLGLPYQNKASSGASSGASPPGMSLNSSDEKEHNLELIIMSAIVGGLVLIAAKT